MGGQEILRKEVARILGGETGPRRQSGETRTREDIDVELLRDAHRPSQPILPVQSPLVGLFPCIFGQMHLGALAVWP